jgi:hypothetical protein
MSLTKAETVFASILTWNRLCFGNRRCATALRKSGTSTREPPMTRAGLVLTALAVAVTTAGAGPTPGAAQARRHSEIDGGHGAHLGVLAERSNLVFIGRVASVEYRRSQPSTENRGMPHTIVTYTIGQVLRGRSPGKTLTIRFIGGSDGAGRFLEVAGVPRFQVGEEDLLFVEDNGAAKCPLVHCEWGRFRLLQGGMYNNHGFPVRAVRDTHVIARGTPPKEFMTFRYPAPRFDDLIKNPEVQGLIRQQGIPITDLRRRYESEAPKDIVLSREIPEAASYDTLRSATGAPARAIAATPDDIPVGPMAIEEFLKILKPILGSVTRKPVPVRSIDPRAPIVDSVPRPRAPAAPPKARAVIQPRTRQDAAELDSLRRKDFDPVIRRP